MSLKSDNISCYAYDKDCYIVKHDFIFDAMRKVTSQRIRFQAAKLILEFNSENPLILSLTTAKRLELLFATNEYDKVLKIWFELVNELNYQHEYFSILNLSDVVLEAYDKTDFPGRDPYVLEKIISSILDTYIEVRILNDEKFIALMEKYETICNLHKYQEDGAEIRIRFLFYKWNQLFYGAEINSSYDVVLEAKKLVDKNNIQDYDLCGRIYWAFALSHKRVSSIDEGIKDFEDGLGRYPDCILLYIGLTLHKAHLNLRRTPSATEQICRDLLNNVEGKKCPYHEILQIRVDIVMAEFYAKKYTDALKDCLEVLQIAQSINAAYQIGRLYNIYGACELMNNAPEKAIMLFRKAQYEFHESGNSLFEWRVEFNISQINFRCGNEKKAMECFENIYRNGMPNLEERITDLTFDNIEVAAFLYTERIVKKSKQCKAGSKIVDLFMQNNIYKEIANLSDDKFKALLEDYAYLHNGYFICLG